MSVTLFSEHQTFEAVADRLQDTAFQKIHVRR